MQQLLTKPGQVFSTPAGRYTVQRSMPSVGIYRIEVLTAGTVARPVEDLTRSYPIKQVAQVIHTVLVKALSTPGANVASARRAVFDHLTGEIALVSTVPSAQAALKVEYLQDLRAGFADDLAAVTA